MQKWVSFVLLLLVILPILLGGPTHAQNLDRKLRTSDSKESARTDLLKKYYSRYMGILIDIEAEAIKLNADIEASRAAVERTNEGLLPLRQEVNRITSLAILSTLLPLQYLIVERELGSGPFWKWGARAVFSLGAVSFAFKSSHASVNGSQEGNPELWAAVEVEMASFTRQIAPYFSLNQKAQAQAAAVLTQYCIEHFLKAGPEVDMTEKGLKGFIAYEDLLGELVTQGLISKAQIEAYHRLRETMDGYMKLNPKAHAEEVAQEIEGLDALSREELNGFACALRQSLRAVVAALKEAEVLESKNWIAECTRMDQTLAVAFPECR